MEKSKLGIYDLLTPEEKVVCIKVYDKEISVLLKKLDSQRSDEYNRLIGEVMEKSVEEVNASQSKKIDKNMQGLTKKQLITGILEFERQERELKLDLIDIENEEVLTDAELERKRDEKLKEWEEKRAKEFGSFPIAEIKRRFKGLCLIKLAEIDAVEQLKYIILYCKCFDPDNPDQRFFSLQEKDKNNKQIPFHPQKLIPDFINELLWEVGEFDPVVDEREVRRLATSPDFLASTTSPDSKEGQ